MGMMIRSTVLDRWSELRSLLPASFDLASTAQSRGAFTRARGVKDVETLLRLALAYGACGMSLRETCAWAHAAGVATVSDPSLLARLVKASDWLGDLVGAVVAERANVPVGRFAGHRLRALDATSICHPGADRTSWRLHVGYDLASGETDHVDVTDCHGAESLRRLTYQPGEIVLADRGYARPRDLRPVTAAGADFIVRIGWNSLRLLHPNGGLFNLSAALEAQTEQDGEVLIRVHEGKTGDKTGEVSTPEPLIVRLVIRRKDAAQAEAAQQRLLKEARKRGRQPDPRSLEAAKYILLITSLPADAAFSTADVLALYRFRWQIELAFKRMKSIAGLDELPARTPQLARAWIYARLIAVLLAERIAGNIPDSSPCGPHETNAQSIAMAAHAHGLAQHHRRHPPRAILANAPRRQRLYPHVSL
jgi:hypothetical protein